MTQAEQDRLEYLTTKADGGELTEGEREEAYRLIELAELTDLAATIATTIADKRAAQ